MGPPACTDRRLRFSKHGHTLTSQLPPPPILPTPPSGDQPAPTSHAPCHYTLPLPQPVPLISCTGQLSKTMLLTKRDQTILDPHSSLQPMQGRCGGATKCRCSRSWELKWTGATKVHSCCFMCSRCSAAAVLSLDPTPRCSHAGGTIQHLDQTSFHAPRPFIGDATRRDATQREL